MREAIWQDRLHRVAQRIGVIRPVQLAHSTLVQVPTVLGWLRPMVLLPVSNLTGLSPFELEAILAHELAHVRRHDYLINLLQSAIETLLFYHPAVWWMSGQIRMEREHACDELVVAAFGDRASYARALTHLEEQCSSSFQPLTLSAAGGSLIGRIRRLIGAPAEKQLSPGWVAGLVVPLAFGWCLLTERNVPASIEVLAPTDTITAPAAPSPNSNATVAQTEPETFPVENDTKPQQVMIAIKFTEVSEVEMNQSGLGSLFAGNASELTSPPVTIQITNRNGVISEPVRDAEGKMVGQLFDNPGLRNIEQVGPGRGSDHSCGSISDYHSCSGDAAGGGPARSPGGYDPKRA